MGVRARSVLSLPLCALLLAACGTQAASPAATASASRSSSPVASPTFAPFPSAAGVAPVTPPPAGATAQPTGLDAGTPPITYAVPDGYSLNLSTPEEVQLTSQTGAEALDFAVDPAQENLSSATGTVTVGGETGYVLRRGPDAGGYGYTEVVVLAHDGTQYELTCIGYSGYDSNRLSLGCASFMQSIAFS